MNERIEESPPISAEPEDIELDADSHVILTGMQKLDFKLNVLIIFFRNLSLPCP